MRFTPLFTVLAAAALFATSACTPKPQEGSAAANADAVADQLEAKANNYSMLADNTASSSEALELENAAGSLGEQSANVRTEAHPKQGVKAPK